VNSLAPSPRSNGSRDFANLHDDSSRRFPSSKKRSSLTTLSCATEPLMLFLQSFSPLGLLPRFLEHPHRARSSITSKGVEVFWVLCVHTCNGLNLPPTDLSLRLSLDLHSPARLEYLKLNSGQKRARTQLLSLLNALYAEEFNYTRCRNLLA
jgi:hypothetical protein